MGLCSGFGGNTIPGNKHLPHIEDRLTKMMTNRYPCAVLAVALLTLPVSDASGRSESVEDLRSSDWYVNAGAGLNWTSDMDQAGWNRDHICYPTHDCGGRDVGGYRWFYDLSTDTGGVLEVAVGRRLGDFRIELAANYRKNDVEQHFNNITHLDGSARVLNPNSDYTSASTATIDDLETRSLVLNAYYDLPIAHSPIAPYVGVGLGASRVKLSGLVFRSWYSCSGECDADLSPPSAYNSWQDETLVDTVFSKHLYAGADYQLHDGFFLGLKLSYSFVNDMSDTGYYIEHPVPDGSNRTKISGMEHWSTMITLKYFFGR